MPACILFIRPPYMLDLTQGHFDCWEESRVMRGRQKKMLDPVGIPHCWVLIHTKQVLSEGEPPSWD